MAVLLRAERWRRANPALAWIGRWGISIASFVSGLAVLFVFRRELPHAGWLVGYVLLVWLLVAVLSQVRQGLEARGRRRVLTAADYTVQSLYHGLLLFLLPAYWASTTLTSPNVLFLGVLVALTLLATVDPWYRAIVYPRPWFGLVFFVVSTFAALKVALPLVGIRPDSALLLAAWAAAAALAPAVRRARRWPWSRAMATTAVVGIAIATLVWSLRVAIPPAPLSLAQATMARDLIELEPVGPFDRLTVPELREQGSLVAVTAVYAPAGLRQPIAHVWRHGRTVTDVVTLAPVRGGRREGFRTHSRKTTFPRDPAGRWSVDVVTTSGQLIGRVGFQVLP